MTWFKKGEEGEKEVKERREELKLSDELWIKCNSCNEIIYPKGHRAEFPGLSEMQLPFSDSCTGTD